MDNPRKRRTSILQTERHPYETVRATWSDECGLLLIFFSHEDLMVSLLTSVKSMQSLHFPFALRTTTGLANHVGWSTPLTRPAASNFLISSTMNSWPSTACFLTLCLTGRA